MDTHEAQKLLADSELVPCVTAPVSDAKELLNACLEADIPASLARDACCGKGGCGCAPKLALVARAEDVPRVTELLHERWRQLAEREGTMPEGFFVATEGDEEPPCPACGHAAALVEGACADCGLQLA